MVGTPRSYKNGKGKTKNGLHLKSIYCRDVSTHDDRAVGNEKRRSLWERRRDKTTNKKRKGSYDSPSTTQAARDSTTKQRKALLCRCRKIN